MEQKVRSYSQLSSYAGCAREFQLNRIEKLPRRPAFWFIGGSAVHETIEAYHRARLSSETPSAPSAAKPSPTTGSANRSTPTPADMPATRGTLTAPSRRFNPTSEFYKRFGDLHAAELASSSFEESEWASGGRGAQGYDWWLEHGPGFVQNFIDWWEASGYEVWIAPDGRPAVELDLAPMFGFFPVRMVIDLIGYNPHDASLTVIDYKAGSTKPKNEKQLGIYASGVEIEFGIRPESGAYFMCRGGRSGTDFLVGPTPLSDPKHSIEYLADQLWQLEAGIAAGSFLANPGESCRTCPMSYACTEVSGVEAPISDPNYPKGI